jgi:Nitrate/nitrite transporter
LQLCKTPYACIPLLLVGIFCAFFIWFAIAPLLSEVKDTLQISKQDIWTSNICSVAGTIVMRFVLGPLCDKYGARILMGTVLMAASIPCALIGLVNSAATLAATRFFIGLGGSSFVMCQYWSTSMFAKEVAGTANALVGGWGNLGGGVTQLVMGSVLFPLFKQGMSPEMAWRTVSIVPACVGFLTGYTIMKISDDCPKGNYKEMKQNGIMNEVSAAASFRDGALNFNTWLLFIQYGCCFGVELTMNNAAASYFKETFDLSTESAAAIASIFGWMNLFARGLGGFTSDKLNAKMGMRGRLIVQTITVGHRGCHGVGICADQEPWVGHLCSGYILYYGSSSRGGHLWHCSVCRSSVHRVHCRNSWSRWKYRCCLFWTLLPSAVQHSNGIQHHGLHHHRFRCHDLSSIHQRAS